MCRTLRMLVIHEHFVINMSVQNITNVGNTFWLTVLPWLCNTNVLDTIIWGTTVQYIGEGLLSLEK